jgi:hypothetical protein
MPAYKPFMLMLRKRSLANRWQFYFIVRRSCESLTSRLQILMFLYRQRSCRWCCGSLASRLQILGHVQAAFMLMVLRKLGKPLVNPYVHVKAAFMLMVLRKLGEPLANPCPCTCSFHADGAAEAWRAACKSLSMYRQRSC